MKRTNAEIISNIRAMLDELEGVEGGAGQITMSTPAIVKKPTGCIGAIQVLITEEFFNEPKDVASVMGRLKEEGRPYSVGLVSMNLLNLVKRKTLRRIQEGGWKYIVRT